MIYVDLINDEAPLFTSAFKVLLDNKTLEKTEVVGITEGSRWKKEVSSLKTVSRTSFFDALDKDDINIEEEIERISKSYDTFNMLACDRYLINKPRALQLKLLVYTFLFYENIFSNENVTHYFTTGIAYTYNLIAYQVSKKYAMKHISFYGIRIENKTAISYDTSNTFNEVDYAYKQYSEDKVTKKMLDDVDQFINRPKQPKYMKNAINSSSLKTIFLIEFFYRFKRYFYSGKHKYDFFTRNPFALASFRLKKILRAKIIELFHDRIFDEVDLNEAYFLFPLHMQPEASTLILAPFYTDQQSSAINISKVVPPNVKLYIKEHRSALGQHNHLFYKNLKKLPNVKVISYRENSFNLIKKSLGTISLSSTIGIESLIFRKPSIVLGEVFYNSSNLTFKAKTYLELGQVLQKIIYNPFILDETKDYRYKLAYYIHCLKCNSYPFEFNVAKLDTKERVMKDDNISNFAKALERLILI